jgi:hypothetical protein
MSYRLGADVGGTFTDVLLVDEQAGSNWRAKTSSTPQDQSAGAGPDQAGWSPPAHPGMIIPLLLGSVAE